MILYITDQIPVNPLIWEKHYKNYKWVLCRKLFITLFNCVYGCGGQTEIEIEIEGKPQLPLLLCVNAM